MMRFSDSKLNREVRDTCRAVHVKHSDSVQAGESDKDGTFRTVYLVTPDKKRVVRVTHHVVENIWEVETLGGSLSAWGDGKTLEYKLDPAALVNRLTGEMREGQLWKGIPRMDG